MSHPRPLKVNDMIAKVWNKHCTAKNHLTFIRSMFLKCYREPSHLMHGRGIITKRISSKLIKAISVKKMPVDTDTGVSTNLRKKVSKFIYI